jgi:subtilisin family serine protease
VIGVAGVDGSGVRLADAPADQSVDLVAPGQDVLGAVPGRGHALFSGSDLATPMVSGAAALVRAAYPGLNADEVARRLVATADAVPDAVGSQYARGMVDPYRAVTEVLTDGAVRGLPAMPAPRVDVAAQLRAAQRRTSSHRAAAAALVVLGATIAIGVAAALVRRRGHPPTASTPAASTPGAAGTATGTSSGPAGLDVDDYMERYFTVPTPPRPERRGVAGGVG